MVYLKKEEEKNRKGKEKREMKVYIFDLSGASSAEIIPLPVKDDFLSIIGFAFIFVILNLCRIFPI